MIIKHGRHIHEVRKGLWALFFSGADWLGRQTLITLVLHLIKESLDSLVFVFFVCNQLMSVY